MTNSFDQLHADIRRRARHLHKRCVALDEDALRRVSHSPALAGKSAAEIARGVQRKHCFDAIARALGFMGWAHAAKCFRGEPVEDMGMFMHRSFGGAHWHVWSADHAEASSIRQEHGGFLLPYRKQFFVARDAYLDELGVDPFDENWNIVDRDLSRSRGNPAWAQLVRLAVAARLFDA